MAGDRMMGESEGASGGGERDVPALGLLGGGGATDALGPGVSDLIGVPAVAGMLGMDAPEF